MFSPYHKFANCGKLQKTIARLRAAGNVSDALYSEHVKYHYSIIHKLKSAKVHFENFEGLLRTTNPAEALGSTDFFNSANMHLDSFFYSSGSVLDILAREILIYFAIPLPARVYFQSARTELATHRPGDSLLTKLDDPAWKNEFSNYRNSLTHELLIGTNYQITVSAEGNRNITKIIFPLPDDPRLAVKTYNIHPDSAEYCRQTLKRLLSVANIIYDEIESRANTSGALPL